MGTGVICKLYKLPLMDARIKCYKAGLKFGKKKQKRSYEYVWPGSNRGYGAITMKMGNER